MKIVFFVSPDNIEYRILPARWEGTSPVTEQWALTHGWRKEEREIPDPPAVHTYSKLRLYDAMVAAGIWEEVKQAIEAAGQWERWNWANDMATDYEPFALLLAQLRQTYGDELTDAILAEAEI